MDTTSENVNRQRRLLLGAAMTVAAVQLAAMCAAPAQTIETKGPRLPVIKPGTNTSFKMLRQDSVQH